MDITITWISGLDRKSTRLNSSHRTISYAVFCLKKNSNTADAACGGVLVGTQRSGAVGVGRGVVMVGAQSSALPSLTRPCRGYCLFFFLKNGGPPESSPFPPPGLLPF